LKIVGNSLNNNQPDCFNLVYGFSGTSKPVIRLALVPIDPKLGADNIKVSLLTHKFTRLKIIEKTIARSEERESATLHKICAWKSG
jgi:hypothetical protein